MKSGHNNDYYTIAIDNYIKSGGKEGMILMDDSLTKLFNDGIISRDNLIEYAVKFVHNTRPGENAPDITNKYIEWGAGPRASSYLIMAAKAKAILNGKMTHSKI